VEAGLRTRDKHRPYPEEMNRHLTGVIADYHFAPTAWARKLRKGIDNNNSKILAICR
jgi:UDP-N-acetylglucosamine 2-epimerase (non-hydrolysing)